MSDNTFYSEFVRDMFKGHLKHYEVDDFIDHYGVLHAAVGIAGEAGEILDLIKKTAFTDRVLDQADLIKELGDVEFYLQALRNQIGVSRDRILDANVEKLNNRHPKGFQESDYYER